MANLRLPLDIAPITDGLRTISETMKVMRDSVAILPQVAETLEEIHKATRSMADEVHMMRVGVDGLSEEVKGRTPEHIMSRLAEGLPKLWVIQRALDVRLERPAAFGAAGTYRALPVEGRKASHAVAFARGEWVVTVVPRLVIGLGRDWGDTSVELPEAPWRNALTGDEWAAGRLPLADLLKRFPVALLVREAPPG